MTTWTIKSEIEIESVRKYYVNLNIYRKNTIVLQTPKLGANKTELILH